MADARFSERKAGDAGFGSYPDQPWRITNGSGGLAVSVNGDNGALWGTAFSPSYVYYGGLTQSSLSDINFTMYDDNYSDNTGAIDLTLYQGFTGVTEANGCMVFEDVPYGTYEVEELMQAGYENASGLGTFTVYEETETINVVNKDLAYIEPCELEIVSDSGTLIIENNDYATSTYVHRNWTDDIAGATWVWESEYVQDPSTTTIRTFQETFTVTDVNTAVIEIAADNGYKLIVNGFEVVDRSNQNNYADAAVKSFDIASRLTNGTNTFQIIVNNKGVNGSNSQSNPAGVLYKLVVNAANDCAVTTEPEPETPPVAEFTVQATKIVCDDESLLPNGDLGNITDTTASDFLAANPSCRVEPGIEFQWATGEYLSSVVGNSGTAGAPWTTSTPTDINGVSTFTVPVTADGSTTSVREILDTDKYIGFTGRGGSNVTAELYCNTDGKFFDNMDWITDAEADETYYCVAWNSPVAEDPEEDGEGSGNGTTTATTTDPVIATTTATTTESDTSSRRSSGSSASGQRFASRFGFATPAPTPQVLGASTVNVCPFLVDYMQIGDNNNALQVTYLQLFLNTFKDVFGGTENPVTGTFGTVTDANVKAFQKHFQTEILDPWYNKGIVPHNNPTGFVYKTTLWKINSLVCPDSAVLPSFAGEDLSSNVDNDINEPIQD